MQSCPLPPSTRPETVKQDVPAKRAPGLGDDVCKDAVQHVSEDAEPAPAITVVSVGVKETPEQPSTVDGAVVCQTALEAVYPALVPERVLCRGGGSCRGACARCACLAAGHYPAAHVTLHRELRPGCARECRGRSRGRSECRRRSRGRSELCSAARIGGCAAGARGRQPRRGTRGGVEQSSRLACVAA